MNLLPLILMVFALVLFVLSGFPVPPEPWRYRLIAWGLACWVLADLLRGSFGAVLR